MSVKLSRFSQSVLSQIKLELTALLNGEKELGPNGLCWFLRNAGVDYAGYIVRTIADMNDIRYSAGGYISPIGKMTPRRIHLAKTAIKTINAHFCKDGKYNLRDKKGRFVRA